MYKIIIIISYSEIFQTWKWWLFTGQQTWDQTGTSWDFPMFFWGSGSGAEVNNALLQVIGPTSAKMVAPIRPFERFIPWMYRWRGFLVTKLDHGWKVCRISARFSPSLRFLAGQSKRKQTTAAKAIQTGLSRRGGPKVETCGSKSWNIRKSWIFFVEKKCSKWSFNLTTPRWQQINCPFFLTGTFRTSQRIPRRLGACMDGVVMNSWNVHFKCPDLEVTIACASVKGWWCSKVDVILLGSRNVVSLTGKRLMGPPRRNQKWRRHD